MQLEISFKNANGTECLLPIQYNYLVQSAIYNLLTDDLAGFLHNEGFQSGKRTFKMFTFSRLLGRFQITKDKKNIIFTGPIKLVISSPMIEFCNSLLNSLLLNTKIHLGNNEIIVQSVKSINQEVNSDKVYLKSLSPIVLYSTFIRQDGKKYTRYFKPGDSEYEKLLESNLRKKYKAFYDIDAPQGEIKVISFEKTQESIIKYKGIIIKGYSGKLSIEGPKELLKIALDSGLGSKNSQGFGCVQLIN